MTSTPYNPSENPSPREDLIETAVRFLSNPNVADRPVQQKQTFLKSKGMTDEEIQISCERASASVIAPNRKQDAVIPIYNVPQQPLVPQLPSLWTSVRDILHTLALLGGLGYAIFWVYKTYIEPFLFGRRKPKKSTEETLSTIEQAISNVNRCTNELKVEMRTEISRISQERESGAARHLAEIKSDIATVKGLLLSRQQFPSAPTSSSLRSNQNSKPSIPAWQMSAEQKNSPKDNEFSNDSGNNEKCREQHSANSFDSSLNDQGSSCSTREEEDSTSSKTAENSTVPNCHYDAMIAE